MWFVNSQTKQDRLSICQGCEHYLERGTCGNLPTLKMHNGSLQLLGDEITINGEVLHLCGCWMTVKTSLVSQHCPLGKWSSERLSKVDGCDLKDFILSLDEYHVTNEQLQKLFNYKSKISGRHEQVTTCPSCVKDLIENLKKQIRNLEC
jgi:hypothetical protein